MNMKRKSRNLLAFDCSNSSVRTIIGRFDGSRVELLPVSRENNSAVLAGDIEHWDILNILRAMKEGLEQAVSQAETIDSIGLCTWGVDFGMISKEGLLLSAPFAYRNPFGREEYDRWTLSEKNALFRETGILSDPINSVYLLQAIRRRHPTLWNSTDKLLFVPDLLNYFLTGVMLNEPSELSTSQLMDVRTGQLSSLVCKKAGIPESWFPAVGKHGEKIGDLLPGILRTDRSGEKIPVICVPSHDTAAAIVGIPAEEEEFLFLSLGTWALAGQYRARPLISEEVREARLTNELGLNGRITLLRNNAGLYLLQRLKEECRPGADWDSFNHLADFVTGEVPVFDVNDPDLFNPSNMTETIWEKLLSAGLVRGRVDEAVLTASVTESLAVSFQKVFQDIERVTGSESDTIYAVGGGILNHRLCQAIADRTGKKVRSCSSESTALGCVLAQIRYFEPDLTESDLKQIAAASISQKEFIPERRD